MTPEVSTAWSVADKLSLWQVVVTAAVGAIGFWFLHKQNEILDRQNEVMRNQAELNQLLIDREAIERDQQDTMDTLEKIHYGFYRKDEEIDAEIDRLMAKGLTLQQLRRRSFILAKDTGDERGAFQRMDAIQERERIRRATKALYKS